MNPLSIQPAKVHCPPPRDDTLSRERLNSWLERAAAGRLGLIVAEAGFGKTTLLADWALRTQRLTSWYRLEPDDRDWLTFIRHLVAGGRELDPAFAPETFRMLHALGPGGPAPADLTVSIAREMADFGAASDRGLTLLIDDYHLVDGHAETDPIVRALLDRTGPGFSIVISTRTTPRFSLGRLRARGGVMTIDGEAMCFDMAETGRLFRDAYRRPLDEDLVSDLHERTEGWPALLTLVRTGLEDRASADPRALIETLQASRGDLYEFLAEEVMGSLPPDLAHFLTRVSVLMAVDVDTAMLVDGRPSDPVAASIRESERLGLLSRPDRESPHRFHHLVREFLVARLTTEIGEAAVRDLHRSIAERLRDIDWFAAAWHYLMAGDGDACASVVDAALDEIIASGLFEQVRPFLEPGAGDPERPVALILRSRVEIARGNVHAADRLARLALTEAGSGPLRGVALLTLVSAVALMGMDKETVDLTAAALEEPLSETQREIAVGSLAISESSTEGDLRSVVAKLKELAALQEASGKTRFAGISRQNLSSTLLWLGETSEALREATRAEALHGGLVNSSHERVGATAIRTVAMAQLGRLDDARQLSRLARADGSRLAQMELASERARFEAEFGSVIQAEEALQVVDAPEAVSGHRGLRNLLAGQIALRRGDIDLALEMVRRLGTDACVDAAGKFRGQVVLARACIALERRDRTTEALDALRIATAQNSAPSIRLARMLLAIAEDQPIDDLVMQTGPGETFVWSLIAEDLANYLVKLSPSALGRIQDEATLRPERWQSALRLTINKGGRSSPAAAGILAEIGSLDDAAFLRQTAASKKALRPHALRIAQRLARRVWVRDLGAVEVSLGTEMIQRGLRRKVLALLCYLASRPGMASNRDEALEALWPELSPSAAGNSLHQAIYFLRRLFEPGYREGMSAGYILFDGDVINLNAELIDTTSRRCWGLLKAIGRGDVDAVDTLVETYSGRYALDFAYEDWASDYRESLHAAILASVEDSIRHSRAERAYDQTIRLAQAILAIDPTADAIELELLVAYKASGRRAAAAEQYAHYSAFVREELGVEPPSLDDL